MLGEFGESISEKTRPELSPQRWLGTRKKRGQEGRDGASQAQGAACAQMLSYESLHTQEAAGSLVMTGAWSSARGY